MTMKFDSLTQAIRSVHDASQNRVGRIVNQSMNLRNWLIGAYIIEYEQGGEDRAEYGEKLLESLAIRLRKGGTKGLSLRNLKNFRQIALCWPQLEIRQTASAVFGLEAAQTAGLLKGEIGQTASAELLPLACPAMEKRAQDHGGLEWQDEKWAAKLFATLSFSHLVELARVDDPLERAFYEIECLKSDWSVRELKRQRDSMLYQRVGLSKDKDAVLALAKEGKLIDSADTIFRDPIVLEF